VQDELCGGLRVRVTETTTDRSSGTEPFWVVLMHGFGAPGDDLVPLGQQLAVGPHVRFAFPEAPIELGPGCRAWWRVDLDQLQRALASSDPTPLVRGLSSGVAEARATAIGMLDEMQLRLDAAPERLLLGGFSQGAMLACEIALHDPRPLAGLALLSGTMLAESDWERLMPERAGLRVLLSHGQHDPLLPFAVAERLRDAFIAAGLDVTWLPFEGGHGISLPVLDALGRYLDRLSLDAG
jgi:phospholipase/carboxylesterase